MNKGFAHLALIIVVILGIFLVGGGAYLATDGTNEGEPAETPTQVEEETSTSETDNSPTPYSAGKNTATALIVAIEGEKITLDYIDVYTGRAALEMLVADGECKSTSDFDCHIGAPIYDRNVNPALRTFTLASDLQIFDGRERLVRVEEFESRGALYSGVYTVTFNERNEVSKIEEHFRP